VEAWRETKQPYHFMMKDQSLFAFAGIWDRWRSPTGQIVESCSILTTTPNELLRDVHDRMPVILPRERYAEWLTSTANVAGLLAPFDSAPMKRHPVSTLVNRPENDTPECAEQAVVEQNLELWG